MYSWTTGYHYTPPTRALPLFVYAQARPHRRPTCKRKQVPVCILADPVFLNTMATRCGCHRDDGDSCRDRVRSIDFFLRIAEDCCCDEVLRTCSTPNPPFTCQHTNVDSNMYVPWAVCPPPLSLGAPSREGCVFNGQMTQGD